MLVFGIIFCAMIVSGLCGELLLSAIFFVLGLFLVQIGAFDEVD